MYKISICITSEFLEYLVKAIRKKAQIGKVNKNKYFGVPILQKGEKRNQSTFIENEIRAYKSLKLKV